ncbi:MAG: Rnf-Nqr domain containing protein [Pseudohongiella sp.]|nr:Rnf-Nqr domain containing protein [Pseudohongiella sp.]
MSELFTGLISIALVNHLVLTQLLGLEAWFAGPAGLRRSALFGLSAALLMIGSTLISNAFLGLTSMIVGSQVRSGFALPVVMVVSALLLMPLRLILMRFAPVELPVLKRSFPLLALNSAVIGTGLLATWHVSGVADLIGFAIANAVAFVVFLLVFAAIQQRVNTNDVPAPFRGTPILLISAGIMSLAILAFEGVVP